MLVCRRGGHDALHRMVRAGNETAVRFWLELHGVVNSKTWYTAHALDDDERAKPNLCVSEILSFVLSPEACVCRDGNTALMAAASYDHASIVRQSLPSLCFYNTYVRSVCFSATMQG